MVLLNNFKLGSSMPDVFATGTHPCFITVIFHSDLITFKPGLSKHLGESQK